MTYLPQLLRRWPIAALFVVWVAVFAVWPALDLTVSRWFYTPEAGFAWNQAAIPRFFFHALKHIEWAWLALLLGGLLWSFPTGKPHWRAPAVYLLLVLALGPGLLVSELLKNQVGRARPNDISEFGGAARYTPPLALLPLPAECEKNCSFVSGHATIGYYPLAGGFMFTRGSRARRRWFAGGVLLGSVAGACRVVQGAHFFSDVVFAFFAVYFVAWLLAKIFLAKVFLENKKQHG